MGFKLAFPDTRFAMMFIIMAGLLTIGAGFLGQSATVKRYLGIGG